MIDWDSPQWGGGVTYAANGSWVPDRHDGAGDMGDAVSRLEELTARCTVRTARAAA